MRTAATGMKKKPRAPTPNDVETQVLTASQRKCCLCYYIKDIQKHRKGQIAHLDRDRSNSTFGNLVWLCLDHHDEYDSRTSQSKGLTPDEVRTYRDRLYQELGAAPPPAVPPPDQVLDKTPAARVVWCLPRGFLMLEDIEFDAYPSWAVLAHYYHFGEGWRLGTHFHESYLDWWRSGNSLKGQFDKVGIPKGDWDYSHGAFNLITRLRCTDKQLDIKAIVEKLAAGGSPVHYYPPSEPILASQVEGKYPDLTGTHALRDLTAEMIEFDHADYTQAVAGLAPDQAFSFGHRAMLEAEAFLGKKHTSLRFISKVVDQYNREASTAELKRWVRRLREVLMDAVTASRPSGRR